MASSPNQVPRLAEWQEEYEPVTVPATASKPPRAESAKVQSRQAGAGFAAAPAAVADPDPAVPVPGSAGPTQASASTLLLPSARNARSAPAARPRPTGRTAMRGLTIGAVGVATFLAFRSAASINLFIAGNVGAGIFALVVAAALNGSALRTFRRFRGGGG